MITFGNPSAFKYDANSNMLSIKISKSDDSSNALEDILAQLQHVKKANVALSGGIDSQFALRVAKKLNVPVKAYTYLTTWEGAPINSDDVMVAKQVAKQENIDIEIVEFDLKEFFDTNKHLEYGIKYKTKSPQIAFHLYFIEKTFKDKEGTLFLGGEVPMMVKNSAQGEGPLDIAGLNSSFFIGNTVSYRKICKELEIDIVRDLLLYTPNIIYKTLKISIDVAREKGKHCEQKEEYMVNMYPHKLKHEIYEAILPGGTNPLSKNTGFEKLKRYLGSNTGIYNQFDLLYRIPLEEQFSRRYQSKTAKADYIDGNMQVGSVRYIAKNIPQELTEEYRETLEKYNSQCIYEYYFDF